ncbi:MAG: DNA-directed RNA polymerase subunit alpha C-terminal domain-containing protein [Candidatus Absconditabacteria bacterium]|nr:DNA-directed RNA polymerase subunit alpha C-terminal domain-containing protein [Candidatus Absconditabacteria bacterium]MDD3868535.1 DNA-directed RNA polymerase subunit alpha C-terminal domain-containing protein [Candidatus Absconditabacteria bacterium]MDD4714099.1 DNA-directed RNA polymerase subunit alpha C-terminal domain-containing protein [Candidatus Absconditabacteria bacterium]
MLDIQNFIGAPKIMASDIDSCTTRFELKNLPRGFGHTIGNAMRRIILAYNLGGAVTGIKIKGVPHEYHVIDGVKENVVTILLNLKKLRFSVDEKQDTLQWVSQRFKGIGIYTAASLKLPAGIELLNPEEFLFEITDASVEVNMDIRVEKGYGYYSLEYLRARSKKEEGTEVGLMLIDNDFRLVEYVTYDVEEVIEDFTGSTKDSLTIEIKTRYENVSPKEVLMFAGEALASYAKLFIFDDIYVDRSVFVEYDDLAVEKEVSLEEVSVKTMPIDALPLSERTRNALIKNNILYVEDLEKKKKTELLLMKGVGKKAIDEINAALGNIGKMLIG